MAKKTLIIMLLTAVFAIGGLGAFTTAMALEDPCTNFNIQLLEVERDHGDVFIYKYAVGSGDFDISKISSFGYGIDGLLMPIANNFVSVYEPGAGLPSDKWLEGIPQLQAIGITAQSYTESDPLLLYVSGSAGNVGTVAAHTIAGNKIETCFVEGPVPGLPVDASVPAVKIVNLNGVDFCIDINPQTGCPNPNPVVYNCSTGAQLPVDNDFVLGGNPDGSDPDGDPVGPTTPTIIMGEGSDPRCPISKAAHNPCQWIIIGGTAYGEYCW